METMDRVLAGVSAELVTLGLFHTSRYREFVTCQQSKLRPTHLYTFVYLCWYEVHFLRIAHFVFPKSSSASTTTGLVQ